MEAKEFVGKKVVGLNGWKIGKIKDVTIDVNRWQVPSLSLKLDNKVADEFGMKQSFKGAYIPLQSSYVQGIGDEVTLKISKDELHNIVATSFPQTQAPEAAETPQADRMVPSIF